jgi:RNA polymerase sigma-B factor
MAAMNAAPTREGSQARARREAHRAPARISRSSGMRPEELLACYAKNRDRASREALARQFLPLAHRLARRYVRSSEPADDLKQVAALGLLKAIDRFDPSRGPNFASYAIPTILGELRRYFRDSTWAVHVPRAAQERAQAIEAAQEELSNLNGAPPTIEEIAAHLGLASEDVLEGMLAVRAYQSDSLDAPRGSDQEGESRTMLDEIGGEDPAYEKLDDGLSVVPALRTLDERERKVLHLRFVGEMSQSEIAAEVGVSQMQISRILNRTLDTVRERAGLVAAAGA